MGTGAGACFRVRHVLDRGAVGLRSPAVVGLGRGGEHEHHRKDKERHCDGDVLKCAKEIGMRRKKLIPLDLEKQKEEEELNLEREMESESD